MLLDLTFKKINATPGGLGPKRKANLSCEELREKFSKAEVKDQDREGVYLDDPYEKNLAIIGQSRILWTCIV